MPALWSECRPLIALLDAHLNSARQLRAGQARSSPAVVVSISARESGVGDQLSSFLSALTIAIGTGRRLEILPDAGGITSYIDAGFTLPFDGSYTGEPSWAADALAWLHEEHPLMEKNRSSLRRLSLPRKRTAEWGLTVSTGEPALAARLLVASPSGAYPPTHPRVLNARYEFFLGGNTGTVVFRAFFERVLRERGHTYSAQMVSCALRHLLRPSQAVRTLVDRFRPWPQRPPGSDNANASSSALDAAKAPAPTTVVGVHIRAEAHLLNRAAGNESARYEARGPDGIFAADRVFAGCAPHGRPPLSHHHVANFSEYWLTAAAASRWLVERGHASATAAQASPRWLVLGDAAPLRQQAAATWPQVVATTGVVPAQPGYCGGAGGAAGPSHRARVLRVVAELLLLAEAPVIVMGRSRFPMAALLLSPICQQAFVLFQDRTCRRRRRRRQGSAKASATSASAADRMGAHESWRDPVQTLPLTPADVPASGDPVPRLVLTGTRKALRCVGTAQAYSARRLLDAEGRLVQDGMLSNF